MQGGHKYLVLQQTCKDPAPDFSCGFCERSSWNEKSIIKGWILSKPLLHWGIDFHSFTQQGSEHPEKCLSDSLDPSGDQYWTNAEEGFLSFCGHPDKCLLLRKRNWLWEACIFYLILLPVNQNPPTLPNVSLLTQNLMIGLKHVHVVYLWTFLTRWTKDVQNIVFPPLRFHYCCWTLKYLLEANSCYTAINTKFLATDKTWETSILTASC